jgi:preprotein translocase subunit YajC
MKKRGISNVITTMTLILLAILAIMLIAIIIYFIIRNQTEISEAKQKLLTQDVNIGNITFSGTDVNITVARGATRQVVINLTQKQTPTYADIVLVSDLSGSMLAGINCTKDSKNIFNSSNGTGDNTIRNALNLSYVADKCGNIVNESYFNCEYRIVNKTLCEDILGGANYKPRKVSEVTDANVEVVNKILNAPGLKSEGKKIGVIFFNETVKSSSIHPMADKSDVEGIVSFIRNSWTIIAGAGTCICCGLSAAINEMDAHSEVDSKSIILMSDGIPQQNCTANYSADGGKKDAYDLAKEALGRGIVVHTIGFNMDTGTGGEEVMRQIAEDGGGQYFSAVSGNLIDTYTRVTTVIENNYVSEKTDHLIVVFYNATESRTVTIENPPNNPFESATYQVTLNPALTNIIRVEIYPVVVTPSGQKVVADNAVDSWSVEV